MAEPRKPAHRYHRGEATRQRIVETAIESFGREGFDGTSTRAIAAAAEVNTPAIPYYFDNKLGLYHACLDRVIGMVWASMAPAVEQCTRQLACSAAQPELIGSLCRVQDRMIDSFFAECHGKALRRLMAWEDAACDDNRLGRLIQDRIAFPIYRTFLGVVKTIMAKPADPVESEIHAFALMGLSMIFHFNQARAVEMLNLTVVDDQLISVMKAVTGRQLSIALFGLAQPGEG